MASTSAAQNAVWLKGDGCLAPHPRDGVLRPVTVQRLTSASHDNDTAWVVFTDHDEDAEEEKQMEEAIPVLKLVRSGSNHFTLERPLFPGSVSDPKLSVPLKLSDAEEDRVPYTINRYLRDYQREGIRFIYNNYIRSRGCILGDDMGLGKTVQVIGFLAAILHKTGTWEDIENNRPQFLQSQTSKRSKPSKVVLIVAPLSVLYNWKDELETWGHFQCVVVHGLRKEEELARIKKGRVEIALTTYETLRLCLEQFNKIEWCAVVVDEAHKIKNPNSLITQAMKELECKVRIGLTGTILQNNLEELWCVMDWAIPGCLGTLGHFKTQFSDPIEQGQRHSATKRSLATGRKAVRALAKRISPGFFRRTKALIKDQLPKKDDRVVYCSLTDFQQTVYQTVLDSEDVRLLLRSAEKCDCHSGRTRQRCCYNTNSEGIQMKALYFSYLAILRKVANHVALLQSTAGVSKKQEKYVNAICAQVFKKFPDFVQRCKNEAFEALSDPMYSGKMKVLQKLLRHYLQKRDKVLIFSLSTKLLDVLESFCLAEGLDFSRLDGSTNSKQRVQIVKDFNSSSHINLCLVSTMAGGLGLNFVGANVVVLFDPTWNPANDLQAVDRAYRIGQCRDVTVLRLISLGTVEEIIYLRQIYKQQLQSSVVGKESARRYFEAVQGRVVQKGELFGLKNLFRLQTRGTCLTRTILEREEQVEAGVMTAKTCGGEEVQEGTREVSEPGVSSPASEKPSEENGDGSKAVPGGVLDFSSGSEAEEDIGPKRKASNVGADDGSKSGSAGRVSLLQHGFSRLLERVKEKLDLEEGDSSPDADGSLVEEDVQDQEMDAFSSGACRNSKTENDAIAFQKCADKQPEQRNGEDLLLKENSASEGRSDMKRCIKRRTAMDERSDENSSPDKKRINTHKTAVPRVHRLEAWSDESDDFDLESKTNTKKDVFSPHHRGKKRQSASVRDKTRNKFTEDIETFTSSEDEHTPQKQGRRAAPNKTERIRRQKGVSFTNLKSQTSPASKERKRSIDSMLGGVQEVAYFHSNQRVVGGSKAEELISRAAVRDVFERKMYSQVPANHLLSTQESLEESSQDTQPHPANVTLQRPSVDHPVTFSTRSVQNTPQTTFIIGETPKAIRRQQLEEMAERFNFPSVCQFAREILSRNSNQRLEWLQEYYTSLNHPELANTVASCFPQPALTHASSSLARPSPPTKTVVTKCHRGSRTPQEAPKATKKAKHVQTNAELESKRDSLQKNVSQQKKSARISLNEFLEPAKRQKISQKDVREPFSDDPSPESEEQEETVFIARGRKRTKSGSVAGSGAHRADGGLGVDLASSSGLGSGEAAAFLNHTDRDTPSSSALSHGRSTRASKPAAPGRREASPAPADSNNRSFLTDLLGDTSILDDLLKPKSRSAQQSNQPKGNTTSPSGHTNPGSSSHAHTHQVSAPGRASKSSHKDFWDILNEGNEESINKLTDLEEVQRVCINSSFAARKKDRVEEGKGLWKTNEKFIWKK
ncbi:DNA excision repair protein ERCC-6-like 2 [Salarias fasciatus]|uniref:DNA excision repair protein ERCC-6-like 2 n=1 Tax=Salarias fasciatus TaxID=181472 RepID=UPI0011765E80|nr:DNA excision repair protein ERCC-6-like 2 [Salarias fasciatus]